MSNTIKEILLTKGQVAIVDDEDYETLSKYKWLLSGGKYAQHFWWDKEEKVYKNVMMHRLILNAPDDMYVDHINGNKLDNRKSNLRLATKLQNNINVPKYKGKTSKYKGVSWNSKRKRWVSAITINRKQKHIGYFLNEGDAALAYNKYAKTFFGEFAQLNIVEGDAVNE
jgi:hypothetical protein